MNKPIDKKKHIEITNFKVCIYCKKGKPLTEFSRDRTRPDGYNNKCFICNRIKNRFYSQSNAKKESKKRWTKNNELKVKASKMARDLIRREVIKKQNCFFCNSEKSIGHHLLVNFPTKLIWVCIKHLHEIKGERRLLNKYEDIIN